MKLIIEFPMMVLKEYQGPDQVYQTLDDHITDLVQKPFADRGAAVKLNKIDFIEPTPNTNDELVRYELEVEAEDKNFKPAWIVDTLAEEGYEKGLTIKDDHGNSLYHDDYTADIPLRRKGKMK